MDSSAGWLLLGPGKALALQLADAGYDVWMGNVRGNRFSRNHTHLTPEDPAFWRWSWDQIARYDFPAQVNTLVKVSGQDRLVVVGYSQGTMVTLAALASQPEVARHVAGALLLAPVAFTGHMASPPFVWSVRLKLDLWAAAKGWGSWGAWNAESAAQHAHYCSRWPWLCRLFFTAVCGANPAPGGNMAAASVPLLASHLPAGTSVHNMGHWSQVRAATRWHGLGCSSCHVPVTECCNCCSIGWRTG
jgi:pimeloyl-ACP methyl ester carboxylesterase